MTAKRAEIRELAVDELKAGATSAEDRVYPSRSLPQDAADLRGVGPAIIVWVTSERHEMDGEPPTYQTTCELHVEAWATADDDEALDTLLDALGDDVESTIMTGGIFGLVDKVRSIDHRHEIGQRADSRDLAGRTEVVFSLEYKTEFERPEESDFLSVYAETDVPPADSVADITWTQEATA